MPAHHHFEAQGKREVSQSQSKDVDALVYYDSHPSPLSLSLALTRSRQLIVTSPCRFFHGHR